MQAMLSIIECQCVSLSIIITITYLLYFSLSTFFIHSLLLCIIILIGMSSSTLDTVIEHLPTSVRQLCYELGATAVVRLAVASRRYHTILLRDDIFWQAAYLQDYLGGGREDGQG